MKDLNKTRLTKTVYSFASHGMPAGMPFVRVETLERGVEHSAGDDVETNGDRTGSREAWRGGTRCCAEGSCQDVLGKLGELSLGLELQFSNPLAFNDGRVRGTSVVTATRAF